jgi:hypothetical protein
MSGRRHTPEKPGSSKFPSHRRAWIKTKRDKSRQRQSEPRHKEIKARGGRQRETNKRDTTKGNEEKKMKK